MLCVKLRNIALAMLSAQVRVKSEKWCSQNTFAFVNTSGQV